MLDENQLDLEQDELRIQMDQSRDALVQKIERLEEKVAETVENATSSVAEATASVMETVQNASASVSETVDSVTDAVQGTVDSVRNSFEETVGNVKEVFDWRSQVERHPVWAVAGAVAVGYLVGRALNPSPSALLTQKSKKQPRDISPQRFRENHHRNGESFVANRESQTNGYHSSADETTAAEAAMIAEGAPANGTTDKHIDAPQPASRSSGWLTSLGSTLGPEMQKLQGLVIGTALGTVRDLVIQDMPKPVQGPLAEVIDSFTEKLGGTCMHGALISPLTSHDDLRTSAQATGIRSY